MAEKPIRYGMVVSLKPDKAAEYKKLHEAVWPGVIDKITDCNIKNYSIYFKEIQDGTMLLFSYFEYYGDDFKSDMAKMAADPLTQDWWSHCVPCMEPVPNSAEGELWANMQEVFHME